MYLPDDGMGDQTYKTDLVFALKERGVHSVGIQALLILIVGRAAPMMSKKRFRVVECKTHLANPSVHTMILAVLVTTVVLCVSVYSEYMRLYLSSPLRNAQYVK